MTLKFAPLLKALSSLPMMIAGITGLALIAGSSSFAGTRSDSVFWLPLGATPPVSQTPSRVLDIANKRWPGIEPVPHPANGWPVDRIFLPPRDQQPGTWASIPEAATHSPDAVEDLLTALVEADPESSTRLIAVADNQAIAAPRHNSDAIQLDALPWINAQVTTISVVLKGAGSSPEFYPTLGPFAGRFLESHALSDEQFRALCAPSGCDYSLRLGYADGSTHVQPLVGAFRPQGQPSAEPLAETRNPLSPASVHTVATQVPADVALSTVDLIHTPMAWKDRSSKDNATSLASMDSLMMLAVNRSARQSNASRTQSSNGDSDGDGILDENDAARSRSSNACDGVEVFENSRAASGEIVQCAAPVRITVANTVLTDPGGRTDIYSPITEFETGFSVSRGGELSVRQRTIDPVQAICNDYDGGDPLDLDTLSPLSTLDFSFSLEFPDLSFNRPLFITPAPGDATHLYVAEQGGLVRAFESRADITTAEATVFLDLTDRTRALGEQGLLGLAFDPDYANNGYVYVYYSGNVNPNVSVGDSVIARFTADPLTRMVNRATEVQLLRFEQPFQNHNGGSIAIGPDGKLYIASGDGGSGNDPLDAGQRIDTVLGKVLRINTDGSIPNDNPFVNTPGARGEIWAYGIRNPYRFAFDDASGRLWLGDVGQRAQEEVDVIVGCGNYGWRIYEGTRSNINPDEEPAFAFISPIHSYPRSSGRSITGGRVYRGSSIPALDGRYIYGDFVSGRVWVLSTLGNGQSENIEFDQLPNPSSFGTGLDGEILATAFNGRIYRLEPGANADTFPARLSDTGLFSDLSTLTPSAGVLPYEPNAGFWSDGASKLRWLALPSASTIGFSADGPWQFPDGTRTVKHFEIRQGDGSIRRLETRVFELSGGSWQGYTYRWNEDQTDALLLPGGAQDDLDADDENGGSEPITWHYPDRGQCLECHTSVTGQVLGIGTAQLNRIFDDPDFGAINQLQALEDRGLFDQNIDDPSTYASISDPTDTGETLADRARAYLHTNCAQCHQPGGPTSVNMDLRFDTATGSTQTINVAPSGESFDVENARRIAPGDRTRSLVWVRMLLEANEGRMPPLGTHRIDSLGADLVGDWIDAGAN